MEDKEEHFKEWPEKLDLRNIDLGLLKFCLTHSDGPSASSTAAGAPARDPRDYQWLKEALDSIKTTTKDVLKFVAIAKDADEQIERRVAALETLQDLVEDVENANDFLKPAIGGAQVVIDCTGHADPRLRERAASVLATIATNNRKGQRELVKNGAVEATIRALRRSLEAIAPGGEKDVASAAEIRAAEQALRALGSVADGVIGAAEPVEKEHGIDAVMVALRNTAPKIRMRAVQAIGQLATISEFKWKFRENRALVIIAAILVSKSSTAAPAGAGSSLLQPQPPDDEDLKLRAVGALCNMAFNDAANRAVLQQFVPAIRELREECQVKGATALRDLLDRLIEILS